MQSFYAQKQELERFDSRVHTGVGSYLVDDVGSVEYGEAETMWRHELCRLNCFPAVAGRN